MALLTTSSEGFDMKKLSLIVPILCMGMMSTRADAQSTSAASQQLFQDGMALLKGGKVHEAWLDPQLGTLLNLASCHEKEGRIATAWTEYSEVQEIATKKGEDKRAAYAKTKVNDLQSQLPRLEVVVPGGVTSVNLDGVALGQPAWNVALPVDPGDHVITYSAPSKKPGSQNVSTPKGKTTTATLAPLADETPVKQAPIVIAPAVQPQPAPTEPPPEPEHTKGSPLRTAGYAVGAVGVLGLGVGAVFGLVALGDKSTVSNDCQGTQCSQPGLDALSSARRDAAISTVGFVAGGVCLAAGITMVLLGKKKSPQVGLAPMLDAGAGGLVGFGSF
jgi:hypothetical protein